MAREVFGQVKTIWILLQSGSIFGEKSSKFSILSHLFDVEMPEAREPCTELAQGSSMRA